MTKLIEGVKLHGSKKYDSSMVSECVISDVQGTSPAQLRTKYLCIKSWRTEAVCSVSKVTFHVVGEVGPNCEC